MGIGGIYDLIMVVLVGLMTGNSVNKNKVRGKSICVVRMCVSSIVFTCVCVCVRVCVCVCVCVYVQTLVAGGVTPMGIGLLPSGRFPAGEEESAAFAYLYPQDGHNTRVNYGESQ